MHLSGRALRNCGDDLPSEVIVTARLEWLIVLLLAVCAAVVLYFVSARRAEALVEAELSNPEVPLETSAEEVPDVLQLPSHPILHHRSLSQGLREEGHWRGKPAVGDFNGDGALDIVVSIRRWDRSQVGEGLYVYLNEGDGRWAAANEGLRRDMGYGGAAVADVNGDGNLDIAFSGHDVSPHVFMGDGQGHWHAPDTQPEVGYMCSDVALGDVDRDGLVDFVTLGFWPREGGLTVFRGNGLGGWTSMADLLPDYQCGGQVHVHDMDGDTWNEIISATHKGPRVWRFDAGQWQELSEGLPTPEVGGSDLGIAAYDFDQDGMQELVVAGMIYETHRPLVIYRYDGERWAEWGEGLPVGEAFFDVTLANLDGIAPPELVAAGKGGVVVCSMVEPGVFEVRGRLENSLGVIHLTAGDVNGDELDELVCVGFGGVQVLAPENLTQ
jgi:hypothetical protein